MLQVHKIALDPNNKQAGRLAQSAGVARRSAMHIEAAKDGAYISRFPYAADPGVEFLKLGDRMCRWPCAPNEGMTTHFCGKKKIDGSSYCAMHHALGWVTPRGQQPRIQEAA